jgi:HEPN domain-containing protein
MIEDLIELIQSYNPRLHYGIENSLLAKLNSAMAKLAEENTEEAKESLRSFINHVRAQSGKKITAAQAEELIEAAEEILEALE